MAIIDLMSSLMGVRMGFLAFLLIGGVTGAGAWILYPGGSRGSSAMKLLFAAFLGFLGALISSYLGQYLNLFQAGQMMEWLSAILASTLIACLYTALVK
jgi:uncharacterized membrane protein YeaQ/YmgE (transglycosylase-associated protein family)